MTRPNQGLSSLAPGGGKMRDPGNEVDERPWNEVVAWKVLCTVFSHSLFLYQKTPSLATLTRSFSDKSTTLFVMQSIYRRCVITDHDVESRTELVEAVW